MASKRRMIDASYVEKFRNGDMQAFEYIYQFYKDSVYYFSFSYVKNKSDAEDIVQETFIQVIKSISKLKNLDSFHTWLHKICYYTTMQHFRNTQIEKIPNEENFEESIIDTSANPSSHLDSEVAIQEVAAIIENLPTKFKQVAQLRYFDEFTTKEISDIMEIPEGTVKTRLSKIRKAMQPALKRKGFTPEKYLGVAFTPLAYKSLSLLIQNNSMNVEASNYIYSGIVSGKAITVGASIVTVGNSSSFFAKLGFGKIVGATALAGASTFGIYQITKPPVETIQDIAYYKELTNKNIEVTVLFDQAYGKKEIQLLLNDKAIAYELESNQLIFVAEKNGAYSLKIKDIQQEIGINNIDKNAPLINGVLQNNTGIEIDIADDLSGVNFKKSYAVYQDVIYSILDSGQIDGDFDGKVELYLYDQADNMAKYIVDVVKEVQVST